MHRWPYLAPALTCLLSIGLWWLLDLEERRLELKAHHALLLELRAEQAWQQWDGLSRPALELWRALPLDARVGRQVVRYAQLEQEQQAGNVLRRLNSLPWLLEHWYDAVPAAELTELELTLLCWARLPLRELEQAGIMPLTPAVGRALSPRFIEAVSLACPTGCSPLTDPLPESFIPALLGMLESRDVRQPLVAMDLLEALGPPARAALEARLEQPDQPHHAALAFVALQHSLPLEQAHAQRASALAGDRDGLRLLALLELLAAQDRTLLAQVKQVESSERPPAIGVVAQHVQALME